MLTRIQKKRLAREARKLAMECVDGTAPTFPNTNSYCGCAIGEIVRRSGVRHVPEYDGAPDDDGLYYGWAVKLDEHLPDERRGLGVVSRDLQAYGPSALPFPLLALADALEESSEQPPAGPSKDF